MIAALGLLTTRTGLIVAAVVAGLAFLGGAVVWLRHDATQGALNQEAARAAVVEQETQRDAETAAGAAQRLGPDSLLRSGRF